MYAGVCNGRFCSEVLISSGYDISCKPFLKRQFRPKKYHRFEKSIKSDLNDVLHLRLVGD